MGKFEMTPFIRIFIIYVFVCLPYSAQAKEIKKFGLPPFYKTDDAIDALKISEDFGSADFIVDKSPIHLKYAGNKNAPAILFIHGSPGSWNAWAEYLNDPELRKNAFMIAVDRPGFGDSKDGTSGKSLKKQARLIMEAVNQFTPDREFIVVGHSYGGPVTLRIGIDYPQNVASMLLLAPAIAPNLVNKRWYNGVADLWLMRIILPTSLHHSNEEMIPLKNELIKMRPRLPDIRTHVTVIQGGKDKLVAADNATFAQKALVNSNVDTTLLPERGHFIPWEEYDRVKDVILTQITK